MHLLIHVILICFFLFEQEKGGNLSFLDVEVFRQLVKFVTTVYRKPSFSGVCTHFDSFLPAVYQSGLLIF